MPAPEPNPADGTRYSTGRDLSNRRACLILPSDLQREIFLLTAWSYRGVSVHLMLVSSQVKAWIEPFVYKTIRLHGATHALQFLDALTVHRTPEFAKSHVKALCICPSIPLLLALRLLRTCCGLERLALWIQPQVDTAELVGLVSSLPLTFLSLDLGSVLPPAHRSHPSAIQHHPVFANLTHLDIVNHRVLWTSSLGIEHLPFLTHLAFRFWPRGRVHAALSTILRESPKLGVLLLRADTVVVFGSRAYLDAEGIRDVRVVVLEQGRDADEWEAMERESESMWQRAERIVTWRQRHRAGPFDSPSLDRQSGFILEPAPV